MADGATDWETVFEDPATGLISLIAQARTPAALRKSTMLVIESIYARDGAPPEITAFGNELERMLPDDLPEGALPKVTDAVTEVLREIKIERIRRESYATAMEDLADDFDNLDKASAPKKKKKWSWFSRKKKPDKTKKPKRVRKKSKGEKRSSANLMIFAALGVLLLAAGGGGGTYYYFFMDHGMNPGERTMKLIEEMKLAAEGNGPTRHEFGWELIVETRAGLTGVTAIGVPAEACASAAWYFVNRGNVLINDRMPEKIAPSLLKQFCQEKGQLAKLLWLSEARPGMGEETTLDENPNSDTDSSRQDQN